MLLHPNCLVSLYASQLGFLKLTIPEDIQEGTSLLGVPLAKITTPFLEALCYNS